MPYISADQASASFNLLASSNSSGKAGIERTSGLMYFLAFDAVCKKIGRSSFDLNPDISAGVDNRKSMQHEFSKLVEIGGKGKGICQVAELGKYKFGGDPPEKRMSSNFLTVPVKKGSEQTVVYDYPNRPKPLMQLGAATTGFQWGIGRHSSWRTNLPAFFKEITGSTCFTDLAFFVLRDVKLPDTTGKNYCEVLAEALKDKFTSELAEYWADKIKTEKPLAHRHVITPFTAKYESIYDKFGLSKGAPKETIEELKTRVVYLEGLLKSNGIVY